MKNSLLMLMFAVLISCCDPKDDPATSPPGDEGTEGWTPTFQEAPVKPPCGAGKRAAIVEPVTTRQRFLVDCNIELSASDVVTKVLFFRGESSSGVTLDCGGATIGSDSEDAVMYDMIEIRSDDTEPVHDVTIRNCNIFGSIRIWGIAVNGNGERLYDSSRTLEHVSYVRDSSPYRITLDELNITALHRIPLYIAPGVHSSSLTNSVIQGHSVSVMVYLDAESYGNIIDNNVIHSSGEREALAVDGSSYNTISNNQFLSLSEGGIFLYRNCGENGNIRHATPSYNQIENNEFTCYSDSIFDWQPIPGVYFGSRDGDRGYCDDDAGYQYGSSISNYDHSRFNTATQNTLNDCVIKVGNESNHSNLVQ